MVDLRGAAYNITIIYNILVVCSLYMCIPYIYILYNNVIRYYDVGGDDDDDDDYDYDDDSNNNKVILK